MYKILNIVEYNIKIGLKGCVGMWNIFIRFPIVNGAYSIRSSRVIAKF